MNWKSIVAVGSLAVGIVATSQPAQAIQPWDVTNDVRINNFNACKAEANSVIIEAAYQRSVNGVTKDPYLKGIIGSVDRVVLYIAAYEASGNTDTLAGSNAVQAAQDLVDKLTAAIANAGKKNPQVTASGGGAILNGSAGVILPGYEVTPQMYTILGSTGSHLGATGLFNCVDNLVNGGA